MEISYLVMIALIGVLKFAFSAECQSANCFEFCRVQYQGQRSYFNQSDGMCYPVQQCQQGQVYVYQENQCVGDDEPPEPTGGKVVNSTGEYYQDKQIVCVHGKMIGKICFCEKGFYTSSHQDPSQSFVKMCDTKEKPKDLYSQGKNGEIYLNNPNENKKIDVNLDPLYKIIILIGGFALTCCFSCCLVKRMKKKLLNLPL